ncbi:branched-chain amino acid ABC transporter permease [Jiella avicenniae]|uniref:Branched-chain amino acid ABC transporter permease n=1 Tax=Jiella avicenniae TaxID=2907202 RepID=A0A9X1P1L8_9HYPH|nr:branched-chain amino acid ABC transporter permease [Jiella avicenniae]MCE7029402.1 branched-chain amino acid ABC transporter permease [Jiella avicenniae]
MVFFLEQLLNGLNYGLLLFLIAAGLSLVFGVMHLINLAHGSLFMVGAFVTVGVAGWSGSFWLGALVGVVATFLAGLLIERLIVRSLYARSHLDQVLATFGLILFFNELLRWLSGGTPLFSPTPDGFGGAIEFFDGFFYSRYRLAVTVASLVVAAGLWFVLAKTRAGMLVRASASDPEMVRHIGFDVRLVGAMVFAAGAALAGLAGVMSGPLVSVEVGMGEQVLIIAFVIVVVGGMGSIQGTFWASLAIGLVDTLGRAYTPVLMGGFFEPRTVASVAPSLSAVLIYVLMAAVLIARPQGLFAR